jgi:hypothetical protein
MNEQDYIVIIKNNNSMIEKHCFSSSEAAWEFFKFYTSTLPPESSEKLCLIADDRRLWKRFFTLKADILTNAPESLRIETEKWFDVIQQRLDRDRGWQLIQENYNSKFGRIENV